MRRVVKTYAFIITLTTAAAAAWAAEPIRRAWSAQRVTVLEKLTPSAAATVADLLQPGDAVLLKGSRAVAVERVITAIRKKAMSHEPCAMSGRSHEP